MSSHQRNRTDRAVQGDPDAISGRSTGNYMPYTPNTERFLAELAALKPKTLAAMHGSSFVGDGEKALLDLGPVLKEGRCCRLEMRH
jgi:hypothetical protein